MASNSFGQIFRMTTWGESHGKAIGAVIDGCPAGLCISEEEINQELGWRKGGMSPYTTPRNESDTVEILSGVFEGKTTGAPISLIIYNTHFDSSKYDVIKHLLRPGHANFTFLEKYGIFDHRGGGRSSARETACRVAAGAIAKKLLKYYGVECLSYIVEIGGVSADSSLQPNKEQIQSSSVFCHDKTATLLMEEKLQAAILEGDSLGGVVECTVFNVPAGLGDPVYEKLEANLAKAMLSIPASKGIEFGKGFAAARMHGSCHNDAFIKNAEEMLVTETNNAGGTLGGISTGMPIVFRVAMKPTSSIKKVQQTLTLNGKTAEFILPKGSKHDPCVALRAVAVIEAMASLTLVDALLMQRHARLDFSMRTYE